MRKISTFIHVLANSLLPQTKYYNKVLKAPVSFSVKYLFTLIFVLNLFAILIFTLVHKESVRQIYDLKNKSTNILQSHPDDLQIVIDKGIMKTTYERPYFIWQNENDIPIPMIVIDERSTVEEAAKYNALVLVASDGIAASFDNMSYQFRYLPYESFEFDKAIATDISLKLEVLNNSFPFILLLVILGLFIILPIFSTMGALIILLFVSLAVFAGIKLIHRRITLRSVFHIALHSSTLPLLIQYAFFAFGLQMVLPMGFTIIYLLFLTLSLYEVYGVN